MAGGIFGGWKGLGNGLGRFVHIMHIILEDTVIDFT